MPYELVESPEQQDGFKELISGAGRNVARQASNLATRAVGLPGDVFSLVNEYIARPASKALGMQDVPYEETLLGKALPSTEFHRKGVEEFAGDYLKPQNEIEKFADDVIEDAALLFSPAGKVAKSGKVLAGAKQIPRNFYISLGANAFGEGVKQATGREDLGSLAKAGSLGFLSLVNQQAAAKQVASLYNKAEAAIPEGATASAKKMEAGLTKLKSKVLAGRPFSSLAPSEKFVVEEADKVLPLIQNGEIDVKTAWALKRSLNENLSKAIYDIPYKSRKGAKRLATQINGELSDTLKQYGKKNQEFGRSFLPAEEAFGTLAQSEFIKRAIESHIKFNPLTSGLLHLFGSSAVTATPVAIGKITGSAALGTLGSAAIPVTYQATRLGYRIGKSPTLRKIYANVLKAASKEDTILINKYLKELDQGLQEEESKSRYEFID